MTCMAATALLEYFDLTAELYYMQYIKETGSLQQHTIPTHRTTLLTLYWVVPPQKVGY